MRNDEARQSYYQGNKILIDQLSKYNEVLLIINRTPADKNPLIDMIFLAMESLVKELSINLNHLIEFAGCPDNGQEMEINHLNNGRNII